MKKKLLNKAVPGLVLIGIFIVLTTGCDRHARYRVLTFFFTGVPPFEEEGKDNAEKKEVSGREEKLAKFLEEEKKRKAKRVIIMETSFKHGPKAAGQCHQCHESSRTAAFKSSSKQRQSVFSAGGGGGVPGRLVAPVHKLCIYCHAYKSLESDKSKGLWIHGPVAKGFCTLCHDPHDSKFRYMLLKKPAELCTRCHSSGYIMNTEVHKDRADCTGCHNPHRGKNAFLLKKDIHDVF